MRVIDPYDPKFIDSMKIPKGQYAGRSVCDIAATADGLIYLDRMTGVTLPDWVTPRIKFLVERFMTRPHIIRRVESLYGQSH